MIGSIGSGEIFLLFVLALLLFGPRKLPEIGRTVGKAMAEFRGAARNLRQGIEREVQMEELKEVRAGLQETDREIREEIRQVTRGGMALVPEPGADTADCPETRSAQAGGTTEVEDGAQAPDAVAATTGGERVAERTERS